MASIVVQLDSATPITDQIVSQLRQAIAAGELAPGDPLPPVRQLAADLGVNLNTVARAYRALEATGLLSTARGRGTRVTSPVEVRGGNRAERKREVKRRLSNAIADGKLAGMTPAALSRLFQETLDSYFREPTSPRRSP